jgi:putative tricarboxylic transport membrane protein
VLSAAELIIPNTLGSGFGGFGKAVADSLKAEGLLKAEPVLTARPQPTYNLTLDYFNKDLAGKSGKLGVTGFAQVFGALTSKSTTMVSSGVPAARMFAGYSAIAVNANSKYTTIKQLMADLEKEPKAMTIVGGNIGGVDNFAAVQLFEAESIPVELMSYVANNGKVPASLLSDAKYAFGISDIADFSPFVKAGTLRILAVTSPTRVAGISAPTLKSQGIDVVVANWRGIMLPPRTPVAAQRLVIRALDIAAKSTTFSTYLTSQNGSQNFLTGSAWTSYLKGQEAGLRKIAVNAGLL